MSKKLKFKCPECGGVSLDEVLGDAVVVSEVTAMTVDDRNWVGMAYGDHEVQQGGVDHYECRDCGKLVAKDGQDLLEAESITVEETGQ